MFVWKYTKRRLILKQQNDVYKMFSIKSNQTEPTPTITSEPTAQKDDNEITTMVTSPSSTTTINTTVDTTITTSTDKVSTTGNKI